MTDSSSLFTTNSIIHPVPVTAAPDQQSPLLNGTISNAALAEEEEYTIKCICGYADDDGNTVYCEKCDTWQHIECYYPSKKVPEEHFCSDCLPRDVDAKRAAERQRRHREGLLDGGDRKVKRPSSKTTKKKHKDSSATAEQVNGWHLDRHESLSNGRDQPPPAKKPKTSHRTSGSVASVNGHGETRKRASSNVHYPSPSKSPQDSARYPQIPLYTSEFLELYDRDQGTTDAQANEHTIPALNELSSWRSSPSRIAGPGEQPSNHAPFVRATGPLDEATYPRVSLRETERKDVEIDGKVPRWRYITTQTPIAKDTVVGEIRGEVGMLDEYCQQQSSQNRWHELAHPDPFVFFHPHMNIYVDSRKQGTQFRYLRRSCNPNITLKTFITEDGDWRHCFVSKEDIPSGVELAAAWFLNPTFMLNGDAHSDQDDPPFGRQCEWVSRVLANFGDCACSKGGACLFSRFDRRTPLRPSEGQEKGKPGRKKKPKAKTAISPKSTGPNSRAGSEALKQEDDEHADNRSTSGSASEPKSRDMTPSNVAALDADPVLGTQLTDREMRKLKALEQREQERTKTKEKKTKKRTSGGSNLSTPAPNGSRFLANAVGAEQYSGSPPPRTAFKGKSALNRSTVAKPVYVEAATQTEPDDIEVELPPAKRMKFVTPQQRLLRKVLANRSKHEQRCQSAGFSPRSTSASPMTSPGREVEMADLNAAVSPTSARSVPLPSPSTSSEANVASPIVSPTYPLPSQAAHSQKQFKVPAPKLQITSMPPVPTFSANNTPTTGTPGTSGLQQSPLIANAPLLTPTAGSTPSPSPARKKLSLGDYMKSRRNTSSGTTPATEKPPSPEAERKVSSESPAPMSDATVPAPDVSVKQEAVANAPSEVAVEDTPMKDADDDEEEYSPPEAVVENTAPSISETAVGKRESAAAVTLNTASKDGNTDVGNVMARLAQLHENANRGAS